MCKYQIEFPWNTNTCTTHAIKYKCNLKPDTFLMRVLLYTWWRHQWKHFPCYWTFVRGIHRSPVNSPHKGQWRGALMFSLICARINGWVNNREAGDLRRYSGHYDVTVMNTSNWNGPNRSGSRCHKKCQTSCIILQNVIVWEISIFLFIYFFFGGGDFSTIPMRNIYHK